MSNYNNKDIERINKLSFNELRNELAYCNDPVRELLIRKLMKIRYIELVDRKKRIIMQQQLEEEQRQMLIKKKMEMRYRQKLSKVKDNELSSKLIDELLIDDERDIDKTIRTRSMNADLDENGEPKFVKEVKRDKLNNNLMDRLNSDMDIRKYQNMTKEKKEFISPYAREEGNYASWKGDAQPPISDFKNENAIIGRII